MPRSTWDSLPAAVRGAIERETGPVVRAEVPSAGRNSDFSAALYLRDGVVFCKGIADAEGKRGRMHRHEADINPWLPAMVTPRLRWRTDADGWLLLGFDHVAGPHADLSPGAVDLHLVANTVNTFARELAHCPADAPNLAEQWGRLSAWRRLAEHPPADLDSWACGHLDELVMWETRAVELAAGDSLVHTDLHPLNILVSGQRAVVVDWAWSRSGAAVVDAGFLVVRLVAAGHTAAEAERWAETLHVWRETPADTHTAVALAIWGIWEYRSRTRPGSLWQRLVPAARQVAHHLLEHVR